MAGLAKLTGVLSAVLLMAVWLAATDQEAHMSDAAGRLCARSSFAHGYLHGYEEGFHDADLDIHMGRVNSGSTHKPGKPEKELPAADSGSFRSGYEEGYKTGYSDGIGGRAFRAIAELRAIAADLEAPAGSAFDRGFASGYASGRRYISENVAPILDFSYVLGYCLASATENPGPGYCDAYTRGFRLGYDDGTLQRTPALTARNGGH
jgi:hypothetical protein